MQRVVNQRRLLDLARVAIVTHNDRLIRELARDNRDALLSTHIAYNLGRWKFTYLLRVTDLGDVARQRYGEAARTRAASADSMRHMARSYAMIASWLDREGWAER